MSSTRHAEDASEFHAERHASSPEYIRGLPPLEIARRCELLKSDEDRDLFWQIQKESWERGLDALVTELLTTFPTRIGTATMQALGVEPSRRYAAGEVRGVVFELEHQGLRDSLQMKLPSRIINPNSYLLRGEFTEAERFQIDADEGKLSHQEVYADHHHAGKAAEARAKSAARPVDFAAADFLALCRDATESRLERWLQELCTDPAMPVAGGPAYFHEVLDCLRELFAQRSENAKQGRYVTTFGKRIREAVAEIAVCPLNPSGSRPMTLIFGGSGAGKTEEVVALSREQPGRIRYAAVPSGNDDENFFRALCVALGAPSSLQAKASEMKARIEAVLRRWHGVLILDESHRLWPASNLRDNTPKRVEWVNSMTDKGARFVLVAGPQYFDSQGLAEDRVRWNTLQQERRILSMISAPARTPEKDIIGAAKSRFPDASEDALAAIVDAAVISSSPLTTVGNIWSHATISAGGAGRPSANEADIAKGIARAIQSNDALQTAYSGKKGRLKTRRETVMREPIATPARPARGTPAKPQLISETGGRQALSPSPSDHPANGVTESNRLAELRPA